MTSRNEDDQLIVITARTKLYGKKQATNSTSTHTATEIASLYIVLYSAGKFHLRSVALGAGELESVDGVVWELLFSSKTLI